MTRRLRVHLGGIALAALTAAGCADGDATTTNPAGAPVAGDAALSDVVFDVHRDPG